MDEILIDPGFSLSDLAKGIVDIVIPVGSPTRSELILEFLGLKSTTFNDPDPHLRAILHTGDKMVLTKQGLSDSQVKWSRLHEAGHFVLPEHREIMWRCRLEDLDFLTRRRLELEANQFAAEILFQGSRFREDAASFPLGFGAIKQLQSRYKASLEATARRYVEENYFACALVVYDVTPQLPLKDTATATISVRYTVTSKAFQGFKYLPTKQVAGRESYLYEFACKERWEPNKAQLNIRNVASQEVTKYETEVFHNNYSLFQLITKEIAKSS